MARVSRKIKGSDIENESLVYKMGMYLRLSVEESSMYESESILNQRRVLSEYMGSRPSMQLYQEYIDDGRSGTDFERPGFRQMIEDIRANRINGVIVKDLSRFGRNFEETEEYLLKIFPYLKVRFISVFDDYDSLYMNADLILMAIKNLFNDYYSKDVSKKISTTFDRLRKEGKYWGPRPPYGYLIDPEDHHHLVIDQETAGYVKEIFNKVEQGESYHEIVRWLHQNKIVPPMRRCYELGLMQNVKYQNLTVWYRSTLVQIIRNPAYYGALPVAKTKKSLWQNIPHHKIPRKDWVCVENTHEAIITKDQYQRAQDIADNKTKQAKEKQRKSDKKSRVPNMFAYRVYCGWCKRGLRRSYYRQRDGSRGYYFLCENYSKIPDKEKCPHIYITEMKLKEAVFETLSKHIKMVCNTAELIEKYQQSINPRIRVNLSGRLDQIKREITKKDMLKKELYLDLKQGFISEDEYVYMRDAYAKELEGLKEQQEAIGNQMDIYYENPEKMSSLIRKTRKFTKFPALTDELVEIFIKRIEVFQDGELKIELNAKDELEELLCLVEKLGEGEDDAD